MRTAIALMVCATVVVSACGTDDDRTTDVTSTASATSQPRVDESGDVLPPVATSTTVSSSPSTTESGAESEPPATTESTAEPDMEAAPPAELDPSVERGRQHVVTFLDHLAEERWAEAAALLVADGLDWAQRWDLAVLGDVAETNESLASALAAWCEIARCEPPTDVTARVGEAGVDATVTATWEAAGDVVSATFDGHTREGAPAVRGLPPVSGVPAFDVVADVVGAATIVAEVPGRGVVTWVDGEVFDAPVPDDVYATSDGEYVFWSEWDSDVAAGESPETSFAAMLDGRVVCQVPGRMHRLRETADGTFVASVNRAQQPPVVSDEWPVPNFAIECETGEETAIDPIAFGREGGGRSVETIAGRTFTQNWDAEGNGDVLNEQGISVNGDDYAGFHTFSPDAGVVVYGDYGVSISPHTTVIIRTRETVDGSELWSADLGRSFGQVVVTDERVVIGLPPAADEYEPWLTTESLAVFDLRTGERLATIPTDVLLLHVS